MSPSAETRIRSTSILVGYVVNKIAMRQGFHGILRLILYHSTNSPFFSMAGQPLWVFSLLRFEYHTQTQHTLGLLWTSDRPVAETSTYNIHIHKRQISMPPARFEPALPASERPQTNALDRAATGISNQCLIVIFASSFIHAILYYQLRASLNETLYLTGLSRLPTRIKLFNLPTLMHNSLFINNMCVTLLSSTCFEH